MLPRGSTSARWSTSIPSFPAMRMSTPLRYAPPATILARRSERSRTWHVPRIVSAWVVLFRSSFCYACWRPRSSRRAPPRFSWGAQLRRALFCSPASRAPFRSPSSSFSLVYDRRCLLLGICGRRICDRVGSRPRCRARPASELLAARAGCSRSRTRERCGFS